MFRFSYTLPVARRDALDDIRDRIAIRLATGGKTFRVKLRNTQHEHPLFPQERTLV
jgi:DNA/RNA-binding domain of Phe-tRNA-synthetase-like protein